LDPHNNVASIYAHTTGDNKDFGVFVYEAELEDDLNPYCTACSAPVDSGPSTVVTDNEYEFLDTTSDLNHADVDLDGWDGDLEFTWPDRDGDTVTTAASTATDTTNSEGATSLGERYFGFTLESPQSDPVVYPDEEEREQPSLSDQLLRLHHWFNYISFCKIKMMAKVGLVDKRLANASPPMCSACLYGKAAQQPWRTKPRANPKPKDMMHSPTPGLIAH
jgi:hypothetical protein